MENHSSDMPAKSDLQLIVNRISVSSLSSATRKHSFIVNDVPPDLQVNTDENMLSMVFGNLLSTIISSTENCCIRISAKLFGRVVLVHLKESHPQDSHTFNGNLSQAQQLAEKIGGTISVSNDRSSTTTILFSFINPPIAA
jgi:hypothetical protein